MRLQDHIDFTTLQWVKPELDDTLSIAREALESYVDNPAKRDFMRTCADHLHQVHGTLKMVELYGAAAVTAEMEALVGALLNDQVLQREEAYAALMRGLMQLPDYLERLSSGHRDVPVVLLPLLNDLRATRGLEPLPESSMFHPNLDAFLPEQAPAAMSEAYAAAHRVELAGLRLRFQQQLLAWFRGQDAAQQLVAMRKTLLAITARCYHVHGRRLWWIAAGVLEGLEQGMLKGHAPEVRQLIGKVDRNIRLLIEHGENSLRASDADEVACKLLYIVAQAKQRSPHMELLRSTYALDSLLPDAGELEHARGSMAGHNRALLDSVSRALKDDLLRVKEALDLFLREQDGDPAQLAAQGEVLERVGDTLGMLALAVPRRVVGEQRRVLDEIANRLRPADEETLLDVAGALLYVEASLDDHIESLGSEGEPAAAADPTQGLPRSEALGVVSTLMQEAIGNTGKVKDAIVAFVESGWQHDRLAGAPPLMDEVAGAMRMLSSPRPAELAQGVGRFIDYELLQDRRVPSGAQMDHLADALAALEYYLEAAREHRGGLEHILDVAEHSLAQLGYWPVPAQRAAVEEPAPVAEAPASVSLEAEQHPDLSESVSLLPGADLGSLFVGDAQASPEPTHDLDGLRLAETGAPASPASAVGEDWVEIEEQVTEQVPVADPLAANTRFNADAEGIDDDIRDIFLEEMQEEIDNLAVAQKDWLADPAQTPALVGIRRSFHTLKGSGRLVGAGVLGEFAWKVEDMLNRVLDHTIEPDQNVQDVVRHAIDALPQLLAALKGEGDPQVPLSAIMQAAERLAAGQPARVEDFMQRGTETVTRTVVRRVPRATVDAADVPRASLTDADVASAAAAEPVPAEPEPLVDMPAMPPIDPVLLEILRSEVAQYLQTIRTAIQRSEGALPVSEELLRAVHTLHGAIAMVDIPLLTQLLSPLEGLFKRLRASGQPLPASGVRLLGQAADVVDQVMAQFDAPALPLPNVDALTAQITEMRDDYPESQVAHVIFEPQAGDDAVDEPAIEADTARESTPTLAEPSAPEGVDAETGHDEHMDAAAEMTAALRAFEPDAAIAAANAAAEAARQAAAEQAAAEQAAQEEAARERAAAEQAAAEQAAAEQAEQLAAAQAAAEQAAAEQAAAEQAAKQAAARAAATRVEPAPAFVLPDGSRIDADLLEVFIDEAREILDSADGVLAKWHADPADTSCVGELQRDLHTLKGGARIAGLVSVGDLAHAIETVLEKPIRDADKTGTLISALEASFDQLNTMVQRVSQGHMPEYPQAAIDHLLQLAGATALVGEAEPATDASHAPVEEAPQPVAHEDEHSLPELLPETARETHSPQEQIRVRADLLDNLVNHAGEVAIYRSRLEQQLGAFRSAMAELDRTNARLRDQLRRLDLETEAQIVARYQREQDSADPTFDPLELDRFSTLQQLSRALNESSADLVGLQGVLDDLARQYDVLLQQQSRVSSELQDGLMSARMVPFDSIVPRLRRVVRQAAHDTRKQVQLKLDGTHGELDRNVLDRMVAPLEHMLRNSVAHGLETPKDRRSHGKDEEGTITIALRREGSEIVLQVADDGRGLDRVAIRRRAEQRGLVKPDAVLTDAELDSVIFESGFSTSEKVSQLAGRGVGMDVVRNEVRQLGGTVESTSTAGQGATFTLRLPQTLAVTQAVFVQIGDTTYAVPVASVSGIGRISRERFEAGGGVYRYAGEEYALHDMGLLVGQGPARAEGQAQVPLLLVRAGDLRAAVAIDQVVGNREIVVKPVGLQIASVPGIYGATITGDGRVVVILDVAPLVRRHLAQPERPASAEPAQSRHVPLVMVVDDSLTMRKVTGRVLERHNFEVVVARDGVEALERLEERVPDLMLLDIEMPRMDGYELATAMRADERFRGVPIVMITSRTGEKHRQRAFEIGVQRYLGKPYQELDLMRNVYDLLGIARVRG